MCGIAGVLKFDGIAPDREIVQEMIDRVMHRGPDAQGIDTECQVAFGHARLSIIDLAHGAQPMRSADRSLMLTFNGEIFNYIELRAELESLGHQFRTSSDTEVILHAYQEWGDRCVERFNGQWGFAIWDSRRQRLFVSRDRFGIRPLFYTKRTDRFLFASEIKSLLADPTVTRQIDLRGLDQLFTFWTTVPPATVFRDICELPPGHNMTVEDGEVCIEAYWKIEYEPEPSGATSDDDWAAQLLDVLEDATRLRLRADVPVGAYLSGGLDSSVTTALARRCTRNHLQTFSVTFENGEFDESEHQQRVVDFLQTDHRSIRCGGDTIARIFPEVINHTEKPVLRTAPAPLYLLSQLVREEGFKVVLTGEGADEILGGYDIFKEDKVRRFCAVAPDSALRSLAFMRLYPYMPNIQAQSVAYRKAFFRVRPEELDDPFHSHLPRWELTAFLKRLYSGDVKSELDGYDAMDEARAMLPDDYMSWPSLCRAQFLEASMLMPGYILSSQGDRMAMANSIEGRFPFLDHRVAELAAKMPPRVKMKALCEKYVLKRAARELVPAEVVDRSKQPYRAPDAESFFDTKSQTARVDYVDHLLSPERIGDAGLFNPDAVGALVEKARRGRAIGTKDNMALVGILSTQLLVEQFLSGESVKSTLSAAPIEISTPAATPVGEQC